MQVALVSRIAALALSTSLVGCATMRVSSYVPRGMEIARYRTYGWAPVERLSTGDPRLDNNPFFQARVQQAVEAQLAAKGFEKAGGGMPDLLIHYHASITQEIDLSQVEHHDCSTDDCRPYVYDAGTLLIDLADARTEDLVWRGWAKDTFDGVIDDQSWLETKVDRAVTEIMAGLPRPL